MQLLKESTCWVDKYKPQSSNDLKGQQKNVRRLKTWLSSYVPLKSKPIIMYGPPGIGKTTTAHLVCKEAGYQVVEMNASDQRNKRVIEDIVRSMTSNSRINFFGRASETKDALIIDEVDGMAGNEDRGGIAQLIVEIKKARKPIIFICNDGQSQKIRSLINYCDYPPMEFKRPEVYEIRSVVSNIAANENLNIDPSTMDQLIESTNRDIRQVVNFLSLFKQTNAKQNFTIKTTRLNPFEATKKAFTTGSSMNDRTDCFFSDYNIIPLFIFENYLKQDCTKNLARKSYKSQIAYNARVTAKATTSICVGDLIEKQIRTNQSWSLLPLHALFSTTIPTTYKNSISVGRVDFPQYLGKNSTTSKRVRLQAELNSHTCLKIRGGFNPDYYDIFSKRLTEPLCNDSSKGVDEVISFMSEYDLSREDVDSIIELATWSFKAPPKVDSKAKASLTRAYKKANIELPYSLDVGVSKKRKSAIPLDYEIDGSEVDDEEDEEEDKPTPMPVKKPAAKPSAPKKAKK